MTGIIIALALIVWASYNLGRHVAYAQVIRMIEDVNDFSQLVLLGKSEEYRNGHTDALVRLIKGVDHL